MVELELQTDPTVVLERLLRVLEHRNLLTHEELADITSLRQLSEVERLARLDEVMGKYADVPTSSESFIKRKHEELAVNSEA